MERYGAKPTKFLNWGKTEKNFLKIEPLHDKKAFLRKAWVELANDDVPLDVFKSDFSDVSIQEYPLPLHKNHPDVPKSRDIQNFHPLKYRRS